MCRVQAKYKWPNLYVLCTGHMKLVKSVCAVCKPYKIGQMCAVCKPNTFGQICFVLCASRMMLAKSVLCASQIQLGNSVLCTSQLKLARSVQCASQIQLARSVWAVCKPDAIGQICLGCVQARCNWPDTFVLCDCECMPGKAGQICTVCGSDDAGQICAMRRCAGRICVWTVFVQVRAR